MGKALIAGVIIFIGLVTVGGAMALNYLPNPFVSNVAPVKPNYTTIMDSFNWLDSIPDIPDELLDSFDELNVQVYGYDGETSDSLSDWWFSKNIADGWSYKPTYSFSDTGKGWTYDLKTYTKGTMAMVILTYDGSKIEWATKLVTGEDYDAVAITSSAPYWIYENLISKINN